ncbi:MAG: TIGR03013 family PEP-CTERM/XrtA system glycosyltransferase [Planctomycetes bacterium]|nr:TIGR03013 family PEP-CTERM/XrtA system glycosyltransferase [Planctomycetota bacterium]
MPTLREQIIPRRKLLLMLSETLLITLVQLLGNTLPYIATTGPGFDPDNPAFWWLALRCALIAVLFQIALSYNDLYDWKVAQNRAELPDRLLHSAGYAVLMLAVAVLVFPSLFELPVADARLQWKLFLLVGLSFLVLWAWRAAFHWFFYRWNFGERVLVLGAGPQGRYLAGLIRDNPFSGFEVVGLVRTDQDPEAAPDSADDERPDHRVLGNARELLRIAAERRAARVVVALEERRGTLPVTELLDCKMAGMHVEEKEAMYERIAGKIAVQSLRPSYLIFGSGFAKHRIAGALKRLIDVAVSLVGLVLSAPICVVVAILIRLDSPGPVFFKQERVGQDGELFQVIKFRTMRNDAEARSGPVWAQKQDARVTRIGRFLRVSRIDEIPQMINVLTGHMSFVGPRPERPMFVEQLSRQIPYYPLRHTVKPGLTGWAQVNYPYGASVEDAAEKLRYDLYYVKHMGPLFDLNIILRTVGVILFGKGAR